MARLDTDEAYLDDLYRLNAVATPAADAWVNARQTCEELVQRGVICREQLEAAVQQMSEAGDPARMYRGQTVSIMKRNALRCLPRPSPEAEAVLLAILPSSEYNAITLRGPGGTPIVVYSRGMLDVQRMLVFSILAFMSRHLEKPLDESHTPAEHARTVLTLAGCVAGSRLVDPAQITTYDCLSLPVPLEVATVAIALEEFIILHEFGHVALGHIDTAVKLRIRLGNADVDALTYSQHREHEADRFAAEAIVRCEKNPAGLSIADGKARLAIAAGILLRFCDLIERFRTHETVLSHPPGLARWARIKTALGIAESDSAIGIDDAFDDCLAMFPSTGP